MGVPFYKFNLEKKCFILTKSNSLEKYDIVVFPTHIMSALYKFDVEIIDVLIESNDRNTATIPLLTVMEAYTTAKNEYGIIVPPDKFGEYFSYERDESGEFKMVPNSERIDDDWGILTLSSEMTKIYERYEEILNYCKSHPDVVFLE